MKFTHESHNCCECMAFFIFYTSLIINSKRIVDTHPVYNPLQKKPNCLY